MDGDRVHQRPREGGSDGGGMSYTEAETDRILRAAAELKRQFGIKGGAVIGAQADLCRAIHDSPLPTDREVWLLYNDVMTSDGFTLQNALNAVFANALRLARDRAEKYAAEPGWQLEDLAVEFEDLAEEMASR